MKIKTGIPPMIFNEGKSDGVHTKRLCKKGSFTVITSFNPIYWNQKIRRKKTYLISFIQF